MNGIFSRAPWAALFFVVAQSVCLPFLAAQTKSLAPSDDDHDDAKVTWVCKPSLNYNQFVSGLGTKADHAAANPGETLHLDCDSKPEKFSFELTEAVTNADSHSLWKGKGLGMEEASMSYKNTNWGVRLGLQGFEQTAASAGTVANRFFPADRTPTLFAGTESFSTAITNLAGITAWNKTPVGTGAVTMTGTVGYELNRRAGAASYAGDATYAVDGTWSLGGQFDVRPNGLLTETRIGGHTELTRTIDGHKLDLIAEANGIHDRVGFAPGNQLSGTLAVIDENRICSTFHWYKAITLGGNTAHGGFAGVEGGITYSPYRHFDMTVGAGMAVGLQGGPRGPSIGMGFHFH